MEKIIKVNTSNEDIKYVISGRYAKDNLVVVDDLFILSLKNCLESDVKFCVLCEELISTDEAKNIIAPYIERFKCYSVSKKTYERMCSKDNCAGFLVVTSIFQTDVFLNKDNACVLVCDGLEISGNIGTIFRTCEAIIIDGIVFTNCRAKIVDDKVVRASRGMIFNVPFAILGEKELQSMLINNKFRSIICEPEQGVDFKKFNYSGKVAIVVGNERFGVSQSWFKLSNVEYIKISMFGQMDSLNVAVATSLVIYEAKYNRLPPKV